MDLNLLVPIKTGWRSVSKYGKALISVAGIMLVLGAFLIGYRYGSSIGIRSIIFSSTGGTQVGFASDSDLTLQTGNGEVESHAFHADTNSAVRALGVEEVDVVRESDPSSIVAELENSGFDERICMPLESAVSVPYGWRRDPITEDWRYSSGIRFASGGGDSVCAAMSGVVIFIDRQMSGYEVTVLHPFEITTHYSNLERVVIGAGELVVQDELLGYSSDGSRPSGGLYFEVRQFGEAVEPRSVLISSQ